VTEAERVEVDGLAIAYRRAGSGRSLLLLHGAYEDSRVWSQQLAGLSDEFDVVAVDVPGFGESEDPPTGFTPSDYADCLAGFAAALGLRRPHVVGLSFGSVLALALYQRRPELPATLVLASAYAGWAGSLPPEEVQRRLDQVRRETELPADEFLANWLPTLLTPDATPDLVEEVSQMMRDFHPAGMRAALALVGADFRGLLPKIALPTLRLYGSEDVRSPAATVGAELRDAIPGSRLEVIPGAPHLVQLEAPTAFNAAVRAFLREQDQA
jgi:pimeloyl-ACP methyl ester carboxylesterase